MCNLGSSLLISNEYMAQTCTIHCIVYLFFLQRTGFAMCRKVCCVAALYTVRFLERVITPWAIGWAYLDRGWFGPGKDPVACKRVPHHRIVSTVT